ncbi:hypothetical protein Tco_0252655 [Tanacetum coccineum]
MSRSNIAGGKNWLTKPCLICSQVAITQRLSSLNHTLASPARDDRKSLSLIASALVVPYQNIPQISMNLAIRYKKTFWAAQKVSSQAAETASQAAETASRAAGSVLVFGKDQSADSDGQPGGWLVPIQDYALWEVIENGNLWVPIPVTAPESGPSTALKMIVPSTAEEKI